jgi:hypothetical protein
MMEQDLRQMVFGQHARRDRTNAAQAAEPRPVEGLILTLRVLDRVLEVDVGFHMKRSGRRGRRREIGMLMLESLWGECRRDGVGGRGQHDRLSMGMASARRQRSEATPTIAHVTRLGDIDRSSFANQRHSDAGDGVLESHDCGES